MFARWKWIALAAPVLCFSIPAEMLHAETIFNKTFTYFSISGRSPEDLDRELSTRGPMAKSTGHRHPGATKIKFGGSVTYREAAGRCEVSAARVTLSTNIILPRWKNRRRANREMGLIWDTLSADIKRHEERHAEIARTHAKKLESTLLSLGAAGNCTAVKDRVAIASAKAIEAHDLDQRRFDKIEAINFENRMLRLLRYRVQRGTVQ